MWSRIKRFFHDSETIFLARLWTILGVLAGVITYVEPGVLRPVIPSDWFPVFMVIHGIAMEYLRRRRDRDMQ